MRNRAKCKLCQSIIESYIETDYITCKCGEIAICGGDHRYEIYANDFANIIRIDDNDNEFIPKIVEKTISEEENILYKETVKEYNEKNKIGREELLESLDHMIKNIDQLPDHAKVLPINHYDFGSLLMLLSAILRSE
jgi:hypothetical protein